LFSCRRCWGYLSDTRTSLIHQHKQKLVFRLWHSSARLDLAESSRVLWSYTHHLLCCNFHSSQSIVFETPSFVWVCCSVSEALVCHPLHRIVRPSALASVTRLGAVDQLLFGEVDILFCMRCGPISLNNLPGVGFTLLNKLLVRFILC
jgi:hypothetical protein